MTPEQIEQLDQIKRDYDKCKVTPGSYTTIPMEWYGLLLAALEEAERSNTDMKAGLRSEQRTAMKWYDELTEAQQTIDKLEQELEEMTEDRNMWRSNSEDWDGQEELEYEETQL